MIDVHVVLLQPLSQKQSRLLAHQALGLVDMGIEVRVPDLAHGRVEGNQRHVLGNVQLQGSAQFVQIDTGIALCGDEGGDLLLPDQAAYQLLVVGVIMGVAHPLHNLYGAFRHAQALGGVQDAVQPALHGEGVPVGGGDEGDALVPQLVQMPDAQLSGLLVVRDDIAGVQPGQIAVHEHQRVFLQIHPQQLIAEEGLVLGEQDDAGDVRFHAALQQIVLYLGILALENMADIFVPREGRQDAVHHGHGEQIRDRGHDAGDFRQMVNALGQLLRQLGLIGQGRGLLEPGHKASLVGEALYHPFVLQLAQGLGHRDAAHLVMIHELVFRGQLVSGGQELGLDLVQDVFLDSLVHGLVHEIRHSEALLSRSPMECFSSNYTPLL